MQLDKRSVDKLLSLDDATLGTIIQKVIRDAGIDPSEFGASANDVKSIRRALTGITESDLARISEQYEQYKKSPHKKH